MNIMVAQKKLIIFAGPNGAGKTTAADLLVPQMDDVNEFINADKIAAGLSPYNSEAQAVQSGRLMLGRIQTLLNQDKNFIFETTLATKGFVKTIQAARDRGYHTSLVYIWLPSAAYAKKRVAHRVTKGGHNIPERDIERRYHRSLYNLRHLYWNCFDQIKIYDGAQTPVDLVAIINGDLQILNTDIWDEIDNV